tara:strand:+ start:89 stop:616 length:528 start_codon:yes stop_codon:yes gene_type:complete
MKLGINKIFFLCLLFFSQSVLLAHSENKIKTVPLINLEELSPTFEEDKNELEKIEDNSNSENYNSIDDTLISSDSDKVYINLRALDKITAKTSEIRLTTGEKKRFGSLEIQVLKCEMSEDKTTSDTLAYLQVKDLSAKDNNQVFLFNGWSFVSSPTLKSIDHPIYDLWVTSCENI